MSRFLTSIFLILVSSSVLASEFAVVVGPDSPIQSLNKHQVANIFLSKTNRHSDGRKIRPMELMDSRLRTRFYGEITNKSLAQINSYWSVLVFTGRGRPPAATENRAQLIRKLKNDPYAITYISFDDIPTELRVVFSPD